MRQLRSGDRPVTPFHWEIEFPEVFGKNPGFDAIVGNPPFAGVVQAASYLGEDYTAYLRKFYPPGGGKTDVVAFFFRRTFDLLREEGSLGLLATNTVGQGDTRESGLARFVIAEEAFTQCGNASGGRELRT